MDKDFDKVKLIALFGAKDEKPISLEILEKMHELSEIGYIVKTDESAFTDEELKERLESIKNSINEIELREKSEPIEELAKKYEVLPESEYPETRQERRKRLRKEKKLLKRFK